MDTLKMLKGEPVKINDFISVRIPKLSEIAEIGEERYWGIIVSLCSTSFDHRLVLEEAGIDYLEVTDYQMFINIASSLTYEDTGILIPDIDFSKLIPCKDENENIVIADSDGNIIVDERAYFEMVEFIRQLHNIERNYKIPGNKQARDIYMREARDARQFAGRKKFESSLGPLISGLCNSPGFKYNFETVWDLNIYAFMDAVKRIQKIRYADALLNGMYGGMLDTSKMSKTQLNKDLNWLGSLK